MSKEATPPVPQLALLEQIVDEARRASERPLEYVGVVAVQHLLPTTASLFLALIALGLSPQRTFVLGKPYSTDRRALEALRAIGVSATSAAYPREHGTYHAHFQREIARFWGEVLKTRRLDGVRVLLVLDDGGTLIKSIPAELLRQVRVVGVEQTTSGVRADSGQRLIPVVQVARSAAKLYLESHFVASAVLERYLELTGSVALPPMALVIGAGSIGVAVAEALHRGGSKTVMYDFVHGRSKTVDGVEGLLGLGGASTAGVSAVFGCTGTDTCADSGWLLSCECTPTLASCSSGDVEYRGILQSDWIELDAAPPTADATLHWRVGDHAASGRILNCGYPINFSLQREVEAYADIQLTRALILAGVIQALDVAADGRRVSVPSALSAEVQRAIVQRWWRLRGADLPVEWRPRVEKFDDVEWIRRGSGPRYRI